ncbi:MAG: ribosome biogenesis GTP-binding protein YihA/YsxC [Desulfovibrio sp.]|nr:ribosome biogenesis GTP-binding protein YihA/YsxC [Desulfovibrio sp.]
MESTLELETTAYVTGQLPSVDRPQIALAGRSNVGKSSLINALAGRKKLAKVSAQPGKTRSVNFYRVRPQDFYIVDLPGYGYARASHEERRQWAKTLEAYLSRDRHIRALALLLDCRLPPQKLDMDLAAFATSKGLPVLPILTKADKCTQREREARRREWRDILGVAPIITSASHRQGIDKLWRALDAAALGEGDAGEAQDAERD